MSKGIIHIIEELKAITCELKRLNDILDKKEPKN